MQPVLMGNGTSLQNVPEGSCVPSPGSLPYRDTARPAGWAGRRVPSKGLTVVAGPLHLQALTPYQHVLPVTHTAWDIFGVCISLIQLRGPRRGVFPAGDRTNAPVPADGEGAVGGECWLHSFKIL